MPATSPLSPDIDKQLRTCARRGLVWIKGNLSAFVPKDAANPEHMKEITELALMYSYIYQWGDPELKPRLATVGEFLLDFFNDPIIVQYARKMPNHYDHYFIAYLALRMAGHRLKGYEEALSRVHNSHYPNRIEKIPFRILELKYLLWKAGFMKKPPAWDSTYRTTTLGLSPNPVYLSQWEVYSITHTLMYLTDFSGLTMYLPTDEQQKAIEMTEALLLSYWKKRDWDLTGELLMNMVSLGRSHTLLFQAAARELLQAWRPDGALPGPQFSPSPQESEPKQLFEQCYHTTLVGILFCGAYLHRADSLKRRDPYAK